MMITPYISFLMVLSCRKYTKGKSIHLLRIYKNSEPDSSLSTLPSFQANNRALYFVGDVLPGLLFLSAA
jgi:hypothetical protein